MNVYWVTVLSVQLIEDGEWVPAIGIGPVVGESNFDHIIVGVIKYNMVWDYRITSEMGSFTCER